MWPPPWWPSWDSRSSALLTHDVGDTVGGELLARRAEGSWTVEVTRRVVTNGSIYIDQAHLTNGQLSLLSWPDEKLSNDAPVTAASITRSLRETYSPFSSLAHAGLGGRSHDGNRGADHA